MANVPSTQMDGALFEGEGMGLVSLMKEVKLIPSNGEGFRAIEQGGVLVNDEKVTDTKLKITKDMFRDGALMIKKGKKTFHKIELK